MSRLAKKAIALPKGVEVKISKDGVMVKGPKGSLSRKLYEGIAAKVSEDGIMVTQEGRKISKAMLGLYWALIRNMVEGVSKGFEKRLSLVGVGFRASVRGRDLDLQIGYSHPTCLKIPEELQVKVDPKALEIIITGIDKQLVGGFAADVRSLRKPEPYKGKGIRYTGEYVRKKAGKSAKSASAG